MHMQEITQDSQLHWSRNLEWVGLHIIWMEMQRERESSSVSLHWEAAHCHGKSPDSGVRPIWGQFQLYLKDWMPLGDFLKSVDLSFLTNRRRYLMSLSETWCEDEWKHLQSKEPCSLYRNHRMDVAFFHFLYSHHPFFLSLTKALGENTKVIIFYRK